MLHTMTATDSISGAITRTNDALDRLASETTPQGTVGYTYDAAGRRSSLTVPGQAVANYTFDNANRLTQITDPTGTYQFTFDNMGRLTSASASYSFLTTRSFTTSYSYDAASNRTGFTDPENGSTAYVYDTLNRLSTLTPPSAFSGAGSFGFSYDALSRRTQTTRPNNVATNYDGDNLIEETNSSGAVVARYARNLGIDDPLAMLRSSTTSYYHSDALGSVTSLSNGAGALAQTYSFDSFGKTTPTGSLVNPFQYTGREFDTETNLYFFRARYLDPNTGRFINEDFLRLPDGLSRYDYALNSAVNYVDPFGLCPWQVRQRPLNGGVGNAVKNLADPPPSHKYFYNPITGQSAGLGPAKNPPIYNPGKEVPGKWEPPEDPSKNPDDSLTGQVPDAICDCVDKKAKNPGAPPNYCALGKPHLGQAPCTNCWNWVLGVLKECWDEHNKQQNSH